MDEKELSKIISEVIEEYKSKVGEVDTPNINGDIPVGVSNRHIHLTQEHLDILFGPGYELQKLKDLSQPGQYACKEQLTLIGPSLKAIEGVRVLGPLRKKSQVEISKTDSFTLKVKAPVRESGDVAGSAPITIVGPKGIVELKEGCILANRHIHINTRDKKDFKEDEIVKVEFNNKILDNVHIKIADNYALAFHINKDDALINNMENNDIVILRRD